MADKHPERQFAPVPAQAAEDKYLTAVDFRILALIARRDAFTKNGMGCTMSQEKIGKVIGADRTSVSRSITKLRERRYIQVIPKRRGYEYRVLYLKHFSFTCDESATPTCDESATGDVTNPSHINRNPKYISLSEEIYPENRRQPKGMTQPKKLKQELCVIERRLKSCIYTGEGVRQEDRERVNQIWDEALEMDSDEWNQIVGHAERLDFDYLTDWEKDS